MSNPLSAMLDELMGRHRNAMPTDEKKETTWDDPEVCPYFLSGYCPHEMFTNTKADLGPCYRIHDENLREKYRQSDRFEKAGLEDEFLEFLQRVQNDMQRKIDRNKQRLDLTQPGGEVEDANKERIMDKIGQLSEKITALLSQAEQLGEKGQVEEAQGVVKMMEELKEERDRLQENLDVPSSELRSMEVCDICGCFLIMGDAQHRLDEHFTGKQHLGFAKIRVTIEELLRRKQEKREEREKELRKLREKEEEERRRRRKERSRSRKRSRSRDKHLKSSSSGKKAKRSRSRSRSRHDHKKKIDEGRSGKDNDSKEKAKKEDRAKKETSSRHSSRDKEAKKDDKGKKESSSSHRRRDGDKDKDDKRGDHKDRRHSDHSSSSRRSRDTKSTDKRSSKEEKGRDRKRESVEKKVEEKIAEEPKVVDERQVNGSNGAPVEVEKEAGAADNDQMAKAE